MFMVYWSVPAEGEWVPQQQQFDSSDMTGAMKLMEKLRQNPEIRYVAMASENPNSVGKAGVADPDSDYNWQKRRGNMPRQKHDLNKDDYKDH